MVARGGPFFLVPTVLRGNAVLAAPRPLCHPDPTTQSVEDGIPTEDRGNEGYWAYITLPNCHGPRPCFRMRIKRVRSMKTMRRERGWSRIWTIAVSTLLLIAASAPAKD